MGQKGRLRADIQGVVRRCRLRVRAHRRDHRARPPAWHGGKKRDPQAIGRSRGGLSTKIVALVDALGNLVRFVLLPGQRHDCLGVDALIEELDFEALIADKAFDLNRLREELAEREAEAVIPPRRNRVEAIECDFDKYRWRHCFAEYTSKEAYLSELFP